MSTAQRTSANVIVSAQESRPPGVARQPIPPHNVPTGDNSIPPFARRCRRCLALVFQPLRHPRIEVPAMSAMSAPREQVKSAVALPLAEAALRLRGRPGRPRKTGSKAAVSGYVAGTSPVQPADPTRNKPSAQDQPSSVQPRLLTLDQAATYLSLSPWTVRELEAAGHIRRVQLPVRRLLFDRASLDRLISQS